MNYSERTAKQLARVHAELERLKVGVEKLPSGALRLRRGGCHLMVASLEFINDDDLMMFAGGPVRVQQHMGAQRFFG